MQGIFTTFERTYLLSTQRSYILLAPLLLPASLFFFRRARARARFLFLVGPTQTFSSTPFCDLSQRRPSNGPSSGVAEPGPHEQILLTRLSPQCPRASSKNSASFPSRYSVPSSSSYALRYASLITCLQKKSVNYPCLYLRANFVLG